MTYQIAAALQTYLTRRWAMIIIALAGSGLLFWLWEMGAANTRFPLPPMVAINPIALPIMLATFFLVQQAKWQFVHPRARLMPNYATAHLIVLGGLLLLLLGIYPIVASLSLRLPVLGIAASSVLFAALCVGGQQTQRQVFFLPAMALFSSLLIPQLRGVWLASGPTYIPFRVAILVTGWTGVALWLRRLSRMTEEDDDYLILVRSQFGLTSRIEKSEARRLEARVLSRAKLQSWITDRWHDRLSQQTAQDEPSRQRLLRYGFSPIPVLVRVTFLMLMLPIYGLIPYFIMNRSAHGNDYYWFVGWQIGMFILIAPGIAMKQLSTRRVRLGQELLLPLSRKSLVDGLLRATAIETAWYIGSFASMAFLAVVAIAPQLLTPTNITAIMATILAIQPLMFGVFVNSVLINSSMTRIFLLLLTLTAIPLAAGGIMALGIQVNLGLGILLNLILVAIGWGVIQAARKQWMQAELG